MAKAAFEPLTLRWRPQDEAARFGVWHFPLQAAPKALVVHVHALTEEMNKSRRMVAMQARALAADGCAVLLFDHLGCGDSAGDMADATWAMWVDDVRQATQWATQRWQQRWPSTPIVQRWLWGHRAGCLLALEAGATLPEAWDFLFWQATPNGKAVLSQMLRLEMAGALMGKGDAKVSARQKLASGQVAEVAGYGLHPAMASGLEAARLAPPLVPRRLLWLDVSTQADAATTPAAEMALKNWTDAGCSVVHQTVQGPSFWQTTEIEDAPALLLATASLLEQAQSKTQALSGSTANAATGGQV